MVDFKLLLEKTLTKSITNSLHRLVNKYDKATFVESGAKKEKEDSRNKMIPLMKELGETVIEFPKAKVMLLEKGGEINFDEGKALFSAEELGKITDHKIDFAKAQELLDAKTLAAITTITISAAKAKELVKKDTERSIKVNALILNSIEAIQVMPNRQKGAKA